MPRSRQSIPAQIHYDRRQVALMVRVATYDLTDRAAFSIVTGTNSAAIRAIASGRKAPTSQVLEYFNLEANAGRFTWQIQ
jgi:hypothetical protein